MTEIRNYLVTVAYDGSNFAGWAKQPVSFTIQGKIEDLLSKTFAREIKILATSRTDKGVHALQQKFTFQSNLTLKPQQILTMLAKSLRPEGIEVKQVRLVPLSFHPIRDVKEKEYRYFINTGDYNVFLRQYQWEYNQPLNCRRLQLILNSFVGVKNFYNYCFSRDKAVDYDFVRQITAISCWKMKQVVVIRLRAKSFLRYQVRAIVSQALSCYRGEISLSYLHASLEKGAAKSKYRSKAPAGGLYLWKITYQKPPFLQNN